MPEINVANRTLFHGDNLDFLRAINSGSVNLIATDPPFNKSKDFHATPDSLAAGAEFHDRWSWSKDVHDDWLSHLQKDEPEVWSVITTAKTVYGDDMGAFLCWLGVRLLEMHRILADDGSLYLHIDHTAHAYVKALLDAIFGRRNFRNEIVWHYRRWTGNSKQFQRLHDTLLFYSKSEDYTFNQLSTGYTKGSRDRKEQGVLHRFKKGETPYLVSDGELNESGVPENDVWQIPFVAPSAKERVGYPTQKPLALYERIIKASSKPATNDYPGDIVLDPFCGCATTPVAAERLQRRWIGIDTWDGAGQVIRQRMRKAGFDLGVSSRLPSGRRITITKSPPPPPPNRRWGDGGIGTADAHAATALPCAPNPT